MIIEKKVKNYTVFVKKDGEKYIEIFKDFLSYNHQVTKVFRNIEDTKVVLINTDYGKYILKVFSPKVKNTERFFKSLVKGDYYEKLFRQTERVRREGFSALNDFYLLAEIKTLRYVKTYVMLIEYIEGIELVDMPEISDEVREKIKRSIFFCTSIIWFRVIPIKVTLSCKAVRSELSICPEKDLRDSGEQRIVLI